MKIKSQSLPTRCEICHQLDEFDPVLNLCRRCQALNPYVSKLHDGITQAKRRRMYWSWIPRVKIGIGICYVLIILGILSGLTNIDSTLVKLPIDPDWLTMVRICMGITGTSLLISFGILSLLTCYWIDWQFRFVSLPDLIILGVVFWVFGSIGLPGAIAAHRSANTHQAIQIVEKIRTAQDSFLKTHGYYASGVDQLVQSSDCPNGLTVMEARVGRIGYHGYFLASVHTIPATNTLPARYEIQVVPTIRTGWLRSGNDAYFLDQTGNIRHSRSPTKLADVNSDLFSY